MKSCYDLQGYAPRFMGQYCGDTVGNDKFNVGEFWVDLRCVCMAPLTSALERWTSLVIWCRRAAGACHWCCWQTIVRLWQLPRAAELTTSV